jgi:hypothetical protein
MIVSSTYLDGVFVLACVSLTTPLAALELRFEAFDVFNTQFGLPNATIGSSKTGIINSIVGNPRDLQIAAHLTFDKNL